VKGKKREADKDLTMYAVRHFKARRRIADGFLGRELFPLPRAVAQHEQQKAQVVLYCPPHGQITVATGQNHARACALAVLLYDATQLGRGQHGQYGAQVVHCVALVACRH
jgi:hypothetical protein